MHKQAAFMNHLKEEFVDKKGDIQQLILCPTEYNKDWAKTDYLDILGEQLDPFIHIMWTGDKVVSDITCEGLQWVNRRIRRPCYVWWNFPVNDYCLAHLLTGPVYGLEKNTATDMHAFVSNPMEFAEASKVALWSISQFTWNMGEFDSEKAWYKACEALVPEAPDAFRLFCEHNADIGPNTWMFFRKESFNSDKLLTRFRQSLSAGTYPEKEAAAIINMFARIRKAPETIRSSSANKQLTKEIDPWLTQTAHVGEAGVEAMKMLELAQKKDTENCRKAYRKTREALETTAVFSRPYRRGEQDGIRSGSQVLLPFIRSIVQHVENTLLTDEKPKERAEVLAGSQAFDELSCFCEDNMVGLTPHFPLVTIAPGEYFGFRIEESKQPVALVYDLRKSKSKGRQFQGSVDGKVWFPLQQTGKRPPGHPPHPRVADPVHPLPQQVADRDVYRDRTVSRSHRACRTIKQPSTTYLHHEKEFYTSFIHRRTMHPLADTPQHPCPEKGWDRKKRLLGEFREIPEQTSLQDVRPDRPGLD